MSRAAVYKILEDDTQLSDFPFFAFGAVPDQPPARFGVLRWQDMAEGFAGGSNRGPQRVVVWLYDKDHAYDRINVALERVKTLVTGMIHVAGTDGWTVTQAAWRGDSSDLWDDAYQMVTRNTSLEIVARPQ